MNKKIVINNSSLDNETVMGCEYRNINRCYVDEYFKVGEKIFYQYDPRAKRDCMVEIKDIIELYPTLKGYECKYNLLEDYEASYGWNFIVSRKENLEYEDCDEFDYLIPNLSEYNKENTQKP